jgi:hypothetical protein
MLFLVLLPFVSSFSAIQSPTVSICNRDAKIALTLRRTTIRPPSSRTRIHAYGKGSEIWPAVNEEPILLSASFPGGVIPAPARHLLDSHAVAAAGPPPPLPATSSTTSGEPSAVIDGARSPVPSRGAKRGAVRRTLSHVLASAARASTRRARSSSGDDGYVRTLGVPPPAISRGPAVLALALLGANCVDLGHVLTVVGMTGYVLGLASWCAAPKVAGAGAATNRQHPIVNMPSLPARGHVPDLIKNPLGSSLTGSRAYRTWLRAGALLGVLLPSVVLAQLTLRNEFPSYVATGMNWIIDAGDVREARRIVGGPLFLLCWQAMTEAVARTALLPLPIRILIPVSYNALRLSSLQSWAFFPRTIVGEGPLVIPASLRALGIANLLYWYANLLFFLIPVGVVRYLRAHFFCVEAVEVTVRKGGESSVGLLP